MSDNNNNLPHGVIFDMDGVLLDSEELICKAGCLMFEELGLDCKPTDFIPFVWRGSHCRHCKRKEYCADYKTVAGRCKTIGLKYQMPSRSD